MRHAVAAVNRILSDIAWPAISGSGRRSILEPISDSVRELFGRGRSTTAVGSSGSRPARQPLAADSSAVGAAFHRIADRLAQSEGFERLVPVGVCLLLVAAAALSSLPVVASASAAARPTLQPVLGAAEPSATNGLTSAAATTDAADLYLGDGSIPNTMQNPGVGTDATSMLLTYTVQQGDTLDQIAGSFGLATSTVYWANKAQLPDPASLATRPAAPHSADGRPPREGGGQGHARHAGGQVQGLGAGHRRCQQPAGREDRARARR